MITSPFRKGIRTGITFSVVLIFLMLIGFNTVAASMIGKIFGAKATDPNQIFFLGILYVLLGLWAGGTAARNKEQPFSLWKGLQAGILAGVVFGLIVGLASGFMTGLYATGVDLRQYLSAISPVMVKFYNFNQPPISGAVITFGILALSSIIGSLIEYFLSHRHVSIKLPSVITKIKNNPTISAAWSKPTTKYIVIVIGIAAAITLPRLWGSYWNYILGTVGIYVLLGLGLNIIVGQAGQLVLGYVAFFAVGAYSVALLMAPAPHNIGLSFWVSLIIAIILAAAAGILIGLPILRLRGDYLAIVTLGFGEIIRIMLKSDLLTSLTGGPKGVTNIPLPKIFGHTFSTDVDFMYLILIAMALTIFISYRLQNSRTGRAWVAIREDETVAKATGVNVFYYKILALAIGAAFAGLGGGIFAARNQFTGPEDHIFMVSINVVCLVIVGGMGSIPGVILGALTLKGLPELLRDLDNYRLLAFGALLVIMMITRPDGLWPSSRPKLEKVETRPPDLPGDNDPEKVQVAP